MNTEQQSLEAEEDLLTGIFTVLMLAAGTWLGWKISMPVIWVTFGAILVLSFTCGFIDAYDELRRPDN